MIVFVFLFMYWIVALTIAFICKRNNIEQPMDSSISCGVFWPFTLIYYVFIYPFYYIDEKFSNSKSRR